MRRKVRQQLANYYNKLMEYKFYSEYIVQKARILRRKGIPAKEIAKRIGVKSNTTILRWCADIPSKNSYHLYIKKLHKKAMGKGASSLKGIEINKKEAKILASVLYWCEGAKYPSTNFISFSNSDVNLTRIFLKLFRLGFQPNEKKLRIHLQLHTSHNKRKMISFWSKILKIPKSQFLKPTITEPTKNLKRRNYKGTCTIRYYDVYLLLEIMGIYEGFAKKLIGR